MTYKEFKELSPGRTLVIFERLGQPWAERRIIKRITRTGLFTAPIDSINADSVMQVNYKTFKPLKEANAFAIMTDLGRPIAKFQLIPEPTTKPKKG